MNYCYKARLFDNMNHFYDVCLEKNHFIKMFFYNRYSLFSLLMSRLFSGFLNKSENTLHLPTSEKKLFYFFNNNSSLTIHSQTLRRLHMKQFLIVFNILFLLCSVIVEAQTGDIISGTKSIVVPENIKSLLQQITLAEQNEDWNSYYQLREQIKQAWHQVDPEVSGLYKSTNTPETDALDETAPKLLENMKVMDNPIWGEDLLVHTGSAEDISMVVNRGDTLYLAALNSTTDNVDIYVSGDGGLNWSVYINISIAPSSKIELLDFDGFFGSSGPSYLLLFTLYDEGRLWCTRFSSPSSFVNSIVVDANCTDFAVDRNYPSANYRCFVIYDSSSTQFHKRSDPASYATIWQVMVQIPNCKDPDIAYGLNGSLYHTYIGNMSGNLYINKNYNFGDPSSFFNQHTVETGATDTTFTPEIIASRQDTSSQTVTAVYGWFNNGRRDLRQTIKFGGAGWSSPANWSSFTSTDNVNVSLYSRRGNGNNVFQAVFTRTGLNNNLPRAIRYRKFSSGSWNTSTEVSTGSPTGLQSAAVIEMNTTSAAFAYAGANSTNVYFNNEDWTVDVQEEELIPENYSLEQNYPNPFNPSTTIKYSIPEQSFVKIKVFNLLGQEIAELVNKELQTGNYEVSFNAANFPSGIYFYRIEADNFVQTKKMILMK